MKQIGDIDASGWFYYRNSSVFNVNRVFGMTEHEQRIVASSVATNVLFFLDQVCCGNNLCIDDNRRNSVHGVVSSILPAEIQRAINNVLVVNPLTPNDLYISRTAPLTSKRRILYIYSTNVGTEYFKRALYSPFFFLFKMQFVS